MELQFTPLCSISLKDSGTIQSLGGIVPLCYGEMCCWLRCSVSFVCSEGAACTEVRGVDGEGVGQWVEAEYSLLSFLMDALPEISLLSQRLLSLLSAPAVHHPQPRLPFALLRRRDKASLSRPAAVRLLSLGPVCAEAGHSGLTHITDTQPSLCLLSLQPPLTFFLSPLLLHSLLAPPLLPPLLAPPLLPPSSTKRQERVHGESVGGLSGSDECAGVPALSARPHLH